MFRDFPPSKVPYRPLETGSHVAPILAGRGKPTAPVHLTRPAYHRMCVTRCGKAWWAPRDVAPTPTAHPGGSSV